jgi:hypothetical protein
MPETFKEQCNTEHMIMGAQAGSGGTKMNSTFAHNEQYPEGNEVTEYRGYRYTLHFFI